MHTQKYGAINKKIENPPGTGCTQGFCKDSLRREAFQIQAELQGMPEAFPTRQRKEDNPMSTLRSPLCTWKERMFAWSAWSGMQLLFLGKLFEARSYHCDMGKVEVIAIQLRCTSKSVE